MIPGLPDVKFWVWPKHRLIYRDREARFSPRSGDLMAVLLSCPGRKWSIDELIEHSYSDPDMEPETARNTVRVHMLMLRNICLAAGIRANVTTIRGSAGYRFVGFELTTPIRPPEYLAAWKHIAPRHRELTA